MHSKAIFAGSFNPYTIGHADIVERGLEIFSEIVIALGVNIDKPEAAQYAQERAEGIKALYKDNPRVSVVVYSGLTTDFAASQNATHLLRGVRSVADFEYERNMADVNHKISGIDTVLLLARPELACISSSVVRELQAYGHDVTPYLPTI